jgi:outer membrane murein-binding lipoprotein Lpp
MVFGGRVVPSVNSRDWRFKMGKKKKAPQETQLIKIEEMSLEEIQLAEQLYNSAGLDPVVDAGLKDYDEHLQQEDKLISKVLGPRGADIKGYGEAVAKRVASAVYALLNRQYGGKVGDLRSYIMALQDERDRANTRYDELMGRVVGILGEEYKELRTDSKAFMEKLTVILGEDIKESKIDQKALAERLVDIDGLRSQIITLNKEKKELKETYESQITVLIDEHNEEVKSLRTQIAELASRIKGLESEKTTLKNDLKQLREEYNRLKAAVTTLAEAIPHEEIGKKLGEELRAFLLKDSKVPHMVIDGVGKFIDFRKYLGLAAAKGAEEATKQAEETLRSALSE